MPKPDAISTIWGRVSGAEHPYGRNVTSCRQIPRLTEFVDAGLMAKVRHVRASTNVCGYARFSIAVKVNVPPAFVSVPEPVPL